jgi:hypothetical protein
MPLQVAILRLHYGERSSLPYAIDAAAVLLKASRKLVGASDEDAVPHEVLRRALQRAPAAARDAIAEQADAIVLAAIKAFEDLPEPLNTREPDIFDPRGRDRSL